HRAAWAWVAIVLTPIVLGAAYALMRWTDGQFEEARLVASVIAAVIALIPPTAAVVIGFLEGERVSGRVALAVLSLAQAAARRRAPRRPTSPLA
ncbi:MAG: hypothetical protein ACKOYQ_13980, partial [Actinomycetota bacterium]